MIKWSAPALPAPRVQPWARTGFVCALRSIMHTVVLRPVVWLVCRPLRVTGLENVPAGPVIFVANHSSHADTLVLLKALRTYRVAPAAAEDYFFKNRVAGLFSAFMIGAFPFPRRGSSGLSRAHALIVRGWSVLLFPEGTRSKDGTIGPFKPGVVALAARSRVPVIPIGLSGTAEVLPKGKRLPRRHSVTVAIGTPAGFADGDEAMPAAAGLQVAVQRLADSASHVHRQPLYERVRRFAGSPKAVALCFVWGLAEALLFPIVPDLAVAVLVLAVPSRAPVLALAAVAGSVSGGTLAYALGPGLLEHAPLVTERMTDSASIWMTNEGAEGLRHQPFSGVPYKVFGMQAAEAGLGYGEFLWHSALARGGRIGVVAIAFAGAGTAMKFWVRPRFGLGIAALVSVFVLGLVATVRFWS